MEIETQRSAAMEKVLDKAKKVLGVRISRDAYPLMYERLCDLSGAIEEVRRAELDGQPGVFTVHCGQGAQPAAPDAGDEEALRKVQAIILREAGALMEMWRSDWSGGYFDGRDTLRAFSALRAWVISGGEGDFTDCTNWKKHLEEERG